MTTLTITPTSICAEGHARNTPFADRTAQYVCAAISTAIHLSAMILGDLGSVHDVYLNREKAEYGFGFERDIISRGVVAQLIDLLQQIQREHPMYLRIVCADA